PDGRLPTIVWLANHNSRRSRSQSVSEKNAASQDCWTVSHVETSSGCASKPSLCSCSCAAGAVVGRAAPCDAGLFRRRRFHSGLGGSPFVRWLAISGLGVGARSLGPADRVSERLGVCTPSR